jgi:hypothetical protein
VKPHEIALGILLLLMASRSSVLALRPRPYFEPRRWRDAWVAALSATTGFAMFAWGFPIAALVAVIFVSATILAFIVFILNLLLGEEPVALRVLMILLFCTGLVVEVYGLANLFGPPR